MVKTWVQMFKHGIEACERDSLPGCLVTVVTEENIQKIQKLVLADRLIKLWQREEASHAARQAATIGEM